MTMKQLGKEYGVNFNVHPSMKLKTYLKRNGLVAMAHCLEMLEKFKEVNLKEKKQL